jgi:hypothetical protein
VTDRLRDALVPPDFAPLDPTRIRRRARRRRLAGVTAAAALAAAAIAVPRLVLDGSPRVPAAGPVRTPGAPGGVPSASPAPDPRGRGGPSGGPTHPCPTRPADPRGVVDHADVVNLGGRQYLRQDHQVVVGRGPRVGVVRCAIADAQDPDYRLTDGDSTFLPVGTVLYAVPGLPTDFRVLASTGQVYDARPDRARTGADLLPLAGRVASVDVVETGRPTRRVADPAALVAAVLRAPVRTGVDLGDPTGYLVFRLRSGTTVARWWNRPRGTVEGGIALPPGTVP